MMKLRFRAMKSTLRAGLMLAPLLAIAACSDSTGVEWYVGHYDMTQFRGNALPSGDGTIFIRSGVIELQSGRRFRLEMDRDLEGELDLVVDEGTFSVTNGFLLLNTTPNPLSGAIFPDHIRLNDGTPGSIWEKRQ